MAKGFGADLVGITDYDERWMYVNKFSDMSKREKPQEIPAGLNSVIVVAQAMDYDLIRTVPSALSGAATGTGLRRLMLKLDIAMGYGTRMRAKQWWRGERETLSERLMQLVRKNVKRET